MAFITPQICEPIGASVYEKLKDINLLNIIEFVSESPEELVKKSDCSFKDILALRRILLSTKSSLPVSGDDLYEDIMKSTAILSTGCNSIDSALDGGLYTSEVTELYGAPGAGKTQICLSAAVSVCVDTDQCVYYIDTCGSCDISRLHDILQAKDLPHQTVLSVCSRLTYYQVYDVFELLTLLESLMNEPQTSGCKLLIIDSITAVLSPILGGQHHDGHSYMTHVSRYLKSLASDFSLAVLITNNVVTGDGSANKPALGKSWLPVPHTRLHIAPHSPINVGDTARLSAESHSTLSIATLVRSPRQAVGSTVKFCITDQGVQDLQHS